IFDDDYLKEFFLKKATENVKKYFHYNTSEEKLQKLIKRIGYCNRDDIYFILEYMFSDNKFFIKNLQTRQDEICNEFYKQIVRLSISKITSIVSEELENIFRNVRYIAPLRATAERYYRHQDLQVNEINHTGSNLAMLLKSLPETQKRAFSKWTQENFGFSVRVEELGLHYALKIKNLSDKYEYNINDMGFGFSQILPIVASIWFEANYKSDSRMRFHGSEQLIFTIEQPELHLHPEYQAMLAKLFARVINVNKQNRTNIFIIFETHSQTMIDTLGDCIEDEELSKNDVNIVVFDKGDNQKFTNIDFSEFDSNGDLINWPIGFFSGR
ncbi:TPA: AAA family ATPase, partial [Photobacterium damselae]